MNLTDSQKVIEMIKSFRTDTSNPSVAERFLKNDSNYVVAYIEAERIIGFILGYRLQRYDGQNDMMYIHEVGVLEEYRQMGIAKFFLWNVVKYK
ncbi:MAG: GNAT family N-acetyltransferase [Clostridia bacterium]